MTVYIFFVFFLIGQLAAQDVSLLKNKGMFNKRHLSVNCHQLDEQPATSTGWNNISRSLFYNKGNVRRHKRALHFSL